MKKKTSIGGWAYIWGGYSEDPIPLENVLKRLKELGFEGIEMAAFPPHIEPKTPEKAKEVKASLTPSVLKYQAWQRHFPLQPPHPRKSTWMQWQTTWPYAEPWSAPS